MTRLMAGLTYAPETDTGGGDAPVDIRAAFRAAVLEHAPKPAATEPVADAGDDEDSEAEADADAEPAKPAADKPEKVVAAKADVKPAKTADSQLLTDDEFETLQTTHKDDPIALRKSLEGVFTKKTQALAAERSTYERLKEYQPFAEAYDADPEGTLARLAEMNGFELAPKGAKPAAEKTTTDTVTAAPKPSDFDYDMDRWALAFADHARAEAKREAIAELQSQVDPLRSQTQGLLEKVALDQTDHVMKTFGTQHPDWEAHEEAILALAQKMQPNGMSELEYLDALYNLVTRDAWEKDREANIEREATGRFKKRIQKMDTATSETTKAPTPESQVRKRPPGLVTFGEAYAAAKRGERFDDDE